ncbi:hypothetical protein VNO77_19097 [Canavalia gladiata]|uniref:Uncharacterized protein n=1 Tax=Canavalia gladiata TaxID=3824 RepID=A0AAN9LMR5_CANGL
MMQKNVEEETKYDTTNEGEDEGLGAKDLGQQNEPIFRNVFCCNYYYWWDDSEQTEPTTVVGATNASYGDIVGDPPTQGSNEIDISQSQPPPEDTSPKKHIMQLQPKMKIKKPLIGKLVTPTQSIAIQVRIRFFFSALLCMVRGPIPDQALGTQYPVSTTMEVCRKQVTLGSCGPLIYM